jgi:hypothetical protein
MRKIFRPKRVEAEGCWRRQHKEELRNLYFSPNIIRVNKSRRIRWVGHVECKGEMRNAHEIMVGRNDGKNNLKDLCIGRRKISEWILGKYGGRVRTDLSVSGQEPDAGSCEHDKELSGSIKGGEFPY